MCQLSTTVPYNYETPHYMYTVCVSTGTEQHNYSVVWNNDIY